MEHLEQRTKSLVAHSISGNTTKSYKTALAKFYQFCTLYSIPSVNISVHTLTLFISFLSFQSLAPTTIASHIAALAFHFKVHAQPDPTSAFVVKKQLKGLKQGRTPADIRLPITAAVLQKILNALQAVTVNSYDHKLFAAMYTLAYFGFLRVSELTAASRSTPVNLSKTILCSDIKLCALQADVRLKVTKTNQSGTPTILQLSSVPSSPICPVAALHAYKPFTSAPLAPFFVHYGGEPVTRYQFCAVLSKALLYAKIPYAHRYKAHSFRIGVSTQAAMNSIADQDIKVYGRWSSKTTTHKRYIRIPSSQLI